MMLSTTANGQIVGYGTVGWTAIALAIAAVLWVNRVKSADQNKQPTSTKELDAGAEPLGEA